MQERLAPSSFQPASAAAQEPAEGMDLREVQDFLHRRWPVIAITAVVFMAIMLLIGLTLTPRYTATTNVLLDPRKEKVFGADAIMPDLNLDTGNVDSQVSVIQSINLLRRVAEKQNLMQDAEFGRAGRQGLLSYLMSFVLPSQDDPAAGLRADETLTARPAAVHTAVAQQP